MSKTEPLVDIMARLRHWLAMYDIDPEKLKIEIDDLHQYERMKSAVKQEMRAPEFAPFDTQFTTYFKLYEISVCLSALESEALKERIRNVQARSAKGEQQCFILDADCLWRGNGAGDFDDRRDYL